MIWLKAKCIRRQPPLIKYICSIKAEDQEVHWPLGNGYGVCIASQWDSSTPPYECNLQWSLHRDMICNCNHDSYVTAVAAEVTFKYRRFKGTGTCLRISTQYHCTKWNVYRVVGEKLDDGQSIFHLVVCHCNYSDSQPCSQTAT